MPSGAAHRSASLFWNRIAQNTVLAGRLQGSRPVQRPYVRVGIGYRVRRVTFNGLVLVGDASGYVNPLFGDGILRALSGARQAAVTVEQALRRGDCSYASLANYERQHALHFRVDQALLKLLAALAARPTLPIWLASLRSIRHGLFAALLR
jgi:flavin-dependent dehydrogenase